MFLHKKDSAVGAGPERKATRVIRRWGHLSCEDGLRELGLFDLQKRKLWEDLKVTLQYVKGVYILYLYYLEGAGIQVFYII